MQYRTSEGNYVKMGPDRKEHHVIFTFEGEKEDKCEIVLLDQKTGEKTKIPAKNEYCKGSLRSVAVWNVDMDQMLYYYEINGEQVLDPYAPAIAGRENWNDKKRAKKQYQVYGRMEPDYDSWDGDKNPEIPRQDMVMYKLHVRGFTMDFNKKDLQAGTYYALEKKLSYLKRLGVTTVELLPVYEFEEFFVPKKQEIPDYLKDRLEAYQYTTEQKDAVLNEKINYWGYGQGNYFAVKAGYASDKKNPSAEFRNLVKKMHQLGMECVMEMYFPDNTNHNLILDAIRYWTGNYHIDGFHLLGQDLPIKAIVQDVMLSRTKFFYESFDSGMQETGHRYKNLFVYRDEYLFPARRILNHINGDMQEFLNQQKKQEPQKGFVNYIAGNNGFTLMDSLMYNDRHNEENGENNEDGGAWNFSCNYGIEGPTRRRYIQELREKQWRNAVIMLMTAQGVPLIWAGDEMGNSQKGNNNAYCQDNPTGWTNWSSSITNTRKTEFLRKMIAFRREHTLLANDRPFQFSDYKSYGCPDVSYHGESAWLSGIHPGRMCIGVLYCGAYAPEGTDTDDIYIGFNFFSGISSLALPRLKEQKKWYMAVNSADKKQPFYEEPQIYRNQQLLTLSPQSICILIGK